LWLLAQEEVVLEVAPLPHARLLLPRDPTSSRKHDDIAGSKNSEFLRED
jgi:hypothetical protein